MSIVPPMTRLRIALTALLAILALTAPGCGGSSSKSSSGGGSVPASAGLVPPGAPVYVFGNTDFGGDQWSKLNGLVAKFPDKDLVTGMLRQQLKQQGIDWDADVKPALGPETAAGILSLADASNAALLLNQPKDKAKFDALFAKLQKAGGSSTPTVKRDIDGWEVIADSNASLGRAAAASNGDSLADDAAFKDAMAALPDDALFKVYVDGAAVKKAVKNSSTGVNGAAIAGIGSLKSIVASAEATDSGLEAQAITIGATGAKAYSPQLIDDVPSGALVFLSFDNLGMQLTKLIANPQLKPFLGQFEASVGATPKELADMLAGEGALYVRSGAPLPEVTLLLQQSDPQAALATLDKIVHSPLDSRAKVTPITIGGVAARQVTIPGSPVSLYYAVVDDKLVISDAQAGITGVSGGGSKLADDPVFKEAKDAAGLPDQTTGIFYVNIKDTVPLIDSFASLAGQALPPRATANLEHVRTFMAYGTQSGDKSTFKAFLQIQ
jgi:hypothetical protein